MQERFFIVGCQRTGTTLMRLVLETHPEIYCYDELLAYSVLQNGSHVEMKGSRLVGFKIPRWTEQLDSPVLLVVGPEGPCNRFYRGEKILFLVRDVRDAVCSMMKLKAGESCWCEIWVPPILEGKLSNDPTFRSRYAAELEIIESSSHRLIGMAALYWKYKTASLLDYQSKGFPVMGIPYEGLVTEPLSTLMGICRHLQVPFHRNLLFHNEFSHTELFDSGLTMGNTDPHRPIQALSVGQGVKFFSDSELRVIEQVAGDLPGQLSGRLPEVFSGTWASRAGLGAYPTDACLAQVGGEVGYEAERDGVLAFGQALEAMLEEGPV
jgi:hypothetical protein